MAWIQGNWASVAEVDTMGIRDFGPLRGQENHYAIVHDARSIPWPIADKT